MMPKRSDHFLGIVQAPNEPIKDALKQTMVNQENMFRKQVQELHRAYQMQMFMMKNSRSKEMAETQYLNYSQDDYRGNWSQRPLNCELPAGFYANYRNEHFVPKGNGWGTQEKPIDVECYFQGETESCTEELNLSLNIGGGRVSCASGKKSLEEKVTPASSPHIIDLEESTGIVFNREHGPKSELISAGCSSHFGGQTCLPFCSSYTNSMNKGISSSTKRSLSFLDVITNRREKSSLNQDYEEQRYEDLPAMGVSVVGTTSTSCKAALFDLNGPPCDEPSFHLKDDTGVHSLGSSSTGALDGSVGVFQESMSPDSSNSIIPNDNCSSTQVSTLLQQHTPTSVLTAFNSSRDNSTNDGSSNLSLIDLESCGKPKSENSEDQECLTSNSQQKEGELGLKLDSINSKAEEGLLSSLCRKEDSMEKADIDMSPISSKPDDNGADPSSSLKTMQSVAYSDSSIPVVNSVQSSESSQVDSLGNGNEGSALDDALVRRGAVSLLYFMLENSPTGQNHSIGVANAYRKGDQPERSLDSFESAMLKLKESKVDDYNDVSSNPHAAKDIDEKDCPVKLRRGRRMKDFQKDILPSMASLSRHEICEDVRLMEGVIRSREYKRLRSKLSSEQNWFTPVKSRRSRLNNIGRKCYN